MDHFDLCLSSFLSSSSLFPHNLPLPVDNKEAVEMLSHSYFLACFITLNFLSNWGRAAPVYEEDLHVSNSFKSFVDGKCQAPKLPGIDPLSGCPKDTIFVSQKHPSARYRTINSVLNAL